MSVAMSIAQVEVAVQTVAQAAEADISYMKPMCVLIVIILI